MTYGDIYNEFCKKFPNAEVEDYRPATELHVPQLSKGIPNAIIVWLKDGSKVIYMAESEGKESDRKCHTCKHYTSGEHDGSCGSYICEHYSNWERKEEVNVG